MGAAPQLTQSRREVALPFSRTRYGPGSEEWLL
jgi:hypothetical protein